MVAFTQMMSGAFKGQRRIDDKAKQQDFANRIQNIIYDQQTCTAAMLSGDPVIFDSKNLADFNNDPAKPKITLALGDGTKLKEGSTIDTLSLRVRNEMLPAGSGKYEGSLMMGAPGISSKSVLRPSDLGLVLLTVPEGTGSLRRVTACFSRNDVDGERTCQTLGGVWIKSLTRCLFGSELKLASNEWIDPNEFKAGGPLEGAFVTKCFYKSYYSITSYLCWNVSSSMIAKCMFDGDGGPSSTGWVVKYPTHPPGRYNIKCDNGVLINLPDSSFKFFSDTEITDKVFAGTPPQGAEGTGISMPISKENFLTNYDMLDNIKQCYTDPNGVTTVACNQGDNALEGKVNSCIFIDGGYATANATAEPGQWQKTKYTGWITVNSPRTAVVVGSGASRYTAVQEASGRKCYMLQGVPSSTERTVSGLVTDVKDPFNPAIDNVLKDAARYQQIKECVFLGGQDSGGIQPSPVISPSPATYASSYRGRYLMRYACSNSGIGTDNLVGQVNNAPDLKAKSCWYFENVPVAADFYANSGVTTTGLRRTYTGWMYMRANLTDGTHTMDATTHYVKQNASLTAYTNAVPCNAGVRFTQ